VTEGASISGVGGRLRISTRALRWPTAALSGHYRAAVVAELVGRAGGGGVARGVGDCDVYGARPCRADGGDLRAGVDHETRRARAAEADAGGAGEAGTGDGDAILTRRGATVRGNADDRGRGYIGELIVSGGGRGAVPRGDGDVHGARPRRAGSGDLRAGLDRETRRGGVAEADPGSAGEAGTGDRDGGVARGGPARRGNAGDRRGGYVGELIVGAGGRGAVPRGDGDVHGARPRGAGGGDLRTGLDRETRRGGAAELDASGPGEAAAGDRDGGIARSGPARRGNAGD